MYVNDNVINIYDKEINTFKKGTDQVSVVLRNKQIKKKKTLGSQVPSQSHSIFIIQYEPKKNLNVRH